MKMKKILLTEEYYVRPATKTTNRGAVAGRNIDIKDSCCCDYKQVSQGECENSKPLMIYGASNLSFWLQRTPKDWFRILITKLQESSNPQAAKFLAEIDQRDVASIDVAKEFWKEVNLAHAYLILQGDSGTTRAIQEIFTAAASQIGEYKDFIEGISGINALLKAAGKGEIPVIRQGIDTCLCPGSKIFMLNVLSGSKQNVKTEGGHIYAPAKSINNDVIYHDTTSIPDVFKKTWNIYTVPTLDMISKIKKMLAEEG